MQPLSSLKPSECKDVRVVFSDIDDTLTTNTKIPWQVLETASRLKACGISFCLVTGRPVGFGVTLTNYFDVIDLAITENGGMLSVDGSEEFLFDFLQEPDHFPTIHKAADAIREAFPGIEEAEGNFMRKSDYAFRRASITDEQIVDIGEIAGKLGVGVVASSIQIHLYRGAIDKASAIAKVLASRFADVPRSQVLVMGDSANDESMFNPQEFPLSVGVANIRHFVDQMKYSPRFIAQTEGSEGAREILDYLIKSKSS